VNGADSVSSGPLAGVVAGDLCIGWAVDTGAGITLAAGTGFTGRTAGAGVAATRGEELTTTGGAVAATFTPNAATAGSIAYALAFRALRGTATANNGANFVLIRHDRDEAGNLLAAGTFDPHDVGAGGAGIRTYALYLHGRQGSVQEAFGSRGIPPGAIMGAAVRRGDWIIRCGDTGISFHNHLHMDVGPGPDVGTPPPVALAAVGNSVPFVFRDVENTIRGTDGVPHKLNFYTSTTVET
jgi:hypothetical protein